MYLIRRYFFFVFLILVADNFICSSSRPKVDATTSRSEIEEVYNPLLSSPPEDRSLYNDRKNHHNRQNAAANAPAPAAPPLANNPPNRDAYDRERELIQAPISNIQRPQYPSASDILNQPFSSIGSGQRAGRSIPLHRDQNENGNPLNDYADDFPIPASTEEISRYNARRDDNRLEDPKYNLRQNQDPRDLPGYPLPVFRPQSSPQVSPQSSLQVLPQSSPQSQSGYYPSSQSLPQSQSGYYPSSQSLPQPPSGYYPSSQALPAPQAPPRQPEAAQESRQPPPPQGQPMNRRAAQRRQKQSVKEARRANPPPSPGGRSSSPRAMSPLRARRRAKNQLEFGGL